MYEFKTSFRLIYLIQQLPYARLRFWGVLLVKDSVDFVFFATSQFSGVNKNEIRIDFVFRK